MIDVQLGSQTVPVQIFNTTLGGVRALSDAAQAVDIDSRARKSANLSDLASASTALANLGGAAKSANLSDMASPSAALANLGGVATATLALNSGAGLVGHITDSAGAVYETAAQIFQERLSLASFGVVGDGVADDTAAIQAALDATINKGISLYCPPPSVAYVVTSTLQITRSDFVGAFAPGARLFGCGPHLTVFDNRVANGPMLNVESPTTGKFLFGLDLFGFSILTTTSPVASTAIRLRSAYNVAIKQVTVKGMSADGLNITCVDGDADASNMVYLEHVRLENCGGWGADITSGPGSNEISFIVAQSTFIQGCGTTAATYPPVSGGLRAKNQLLKLKMCAFTINKNVGVFLTGGTGAPNGAFLEQVALENNGGISLLITGGQGIATKLCQIYCNPAQAPAQCPNGVLIDGGTYLIENVKLDGMIVRCTSANTPMTMFKIQGANAKRDSIRVTGTSWLEYDAAGQVRFDNVQFDHVPEGCVLTALSATSLALRPNPYFGQGNQTAYRKRYSVGGLSSSGEIVPLTVESSAGISISNSGLSADTVYYAYLYDNSNVPALELSTTAPVYDYLLGEQVKTGDATRIYKGFIKTNGSSQFPTTGGQYLAPTPLGGPQLGVPSWFFFNDADRSLNVKNSVTPPSSLADLNFKYKAVFEGSKSHDFGSIAAGASATFTMDSTNGVIGVVGDKVWGVSASVYSGGLILSGEFSAGSTITVTAFNPTAGAIDMASATFYVDYSRR